jgi:hypothetical protein
LASSVLPTPLGPRKRKLLPLWVWARRWVTHTVGRGCGARTPPAGSALRGCPPPHACTHGCTREASPPPTAHRRRPHSRTHTPHTPVACREARARAQHCARDDVHCCVLAHHALVQLLTQAEQLLTLRLLQLGHGDAWHV